MPTPFDLLGLFLLGRILTYEPPPPPLVFPLTASSLSSAFGPRSDPFSKVISHHSGVDIPATQGSPVRSIANGLVVFSDRYDAYGNLIVIRHGDEDTTSHYGHLRDILVRTGQKVRAGQIIGSVGSTGRSTGPHLHLEIRKQGVAVDPRILLPALNVPST